MFKDFLTTHSKKAVGDNFAFTHTRIGDSGLNIFPNSWQIKPTELPEFWKKYYDFVSGGGEEYITEKQLEHGAAFAIDLDFRYNYDVTTRQHTKENVADIVCMYSELIKKYYLVEPNVVFDAFVFEKPNVNRLADGSLTKDGIHIIFGLQVDFEIQQLIRKDVMKEIVDILDLPLINTWDSVFDEGISTGKTNWQLYGSKKPSNEAYQLKYHYTLELDGADNEFMMHEQDVSAFDFENDFQKLSVQYPNNPSFPINFKHRPIMAQKQQTTNTSAYPVVVINGKNVVEVYVLLGIKYEMFQKISGHKQWISLGFIIKNDLGDNGEDLFVNLSRHDPKFVEADVRSVYKQLNKTLISDGKKPVTIKTLIKYYKDADMVLAKKIFKEANEIINPKKPNDLSFESVMEEFEKTHAKIANKGVFIKQLDNDNIIMSRQHIKTAYENMIYQKYDKDDKLKNCNFINDWLVNNPEQRCYDDVGVYPKDEMCPSNHFNMWRKFAMEMVTEYEHHQAGLDMVLNHIKILCNHEETVSDYFIKWIAQMIQYPEVKSICPVLISKEGAGKGTLLRLFEKMLGNDKIFQTTTPSRDIWGEFNSHMANSFLVNLDELSKKETTESEGKIKGLITEPKITINNKGVNKYDINSFHRFLITTNNEEPVNTTKDDRRKMIIRSSDEKIGDKEYFEELYELLDDVNVIKTCFEYFKSIPDMDEFHKIKMPCTEYQNELKEISRSPIEKWLEDFTLENITEESVEMSKEEILSSFMAWCSTNKVEYHVDSLKLMVRLNRLNISGVVKHKTKTANKTKFVIEDLKKHFMVGCLI